MGHILSYLQNHTVIAIALALGLLIFMCRKPKLFFGMLFLGLLLAGLFHLVMNIGGLGSEKKKDLIHEEEQQSERGN